jgi:biopolymer transport protein ExbD
MPKRESPEVPAGAMADIAFMLLIFFLVATTMDVDSGLARMLPPKVENVPDDTPPIKERNVLIVQINSMNRIAIEGLPIDISQVKEKAKEFIANKAKLENLPEFEIKDIEFFGSVEVSKGVISLQNDNGTTYETYIAVQNELARAYNELREELSKEKFQKDFDELSSDEQDAVRKYYPQKISEAEPRNIGKK